jgi:hypothetical protein
MWTVILALHLKVSQGLQFGEWLIRHIRSSAERAIVSMPDQHAISNVDSHRLATRVAAHGIPSVCLHADTLGAICERRDARNFGIPDRVWIEQQITSIANDLGLDRSADWNSICNWSAIIDGGSAVAQQSDSKNCRDNLVHLKPILKLSCATQTSLRKNCQSVKRVGVPSNSPQKSGTGGGRSAQEIVNLNFSQDCAA